MRRFSHDKGWGFAPVLNDAAPFPKRLPFRMTLRPAGLLALMQRERMDVIVGRHVVRCRRRRVFARPEWQTIKIADFIGVAARRSNVAETGFLRLFAKAISTNLLKFTAKYSVKFPVLKRLQAYLTVAENYGFTLYLLHEDMPKDLMLYQASDDYDISALWQFWSKKLSLPKLLVDHVGFIHEPDNCAGAVALRRVFERRKSHLLRGRRPVFGRVRPMGRAEASPRYAGREIVARN